MNAPITRERLGSDAELRIQQTRDLAVVRRLDTRLFGNARAQLGALESCTWWVAYLNGKPVAFAGARICKTDAKLVYLSRCGVLPVARGLGLQRTMIRRRIAWARRQPGRRAVITYTLKHNHYSSNNLIRCGFRLYDGKWIAADALYWWFDL
jgi:RimJ/RimL family protein N-acetyltransferase